MAVCHHYRISHSMFLEWSDDDRDKAIAQHRIERSRCRGCGSLPEEWDESQGGDRDAYHAVEKQCRGCEHISIKQASLHAQQRGHGMYIVLKRTPKRTPKSKPKGGDADGRHAGA